MGGGKGNSTVDRAFALLVARTSSIPIIPNDTSSCQEWVISVAGVDQKRNKNNKNNKFVKERWKKEWGGRDMSVERGRVEENKHDCAV